MTGTIDLAGHFGSSLSYATVSVRLARAMSTAGILGTVINLDDKCVHEDIMRPSVPKSRHLMVLSNPTVGTMNTFVDLYKPKDTAIFMSPNTSEVEFDYAHIFYDVGRIYVPSLYCGRAVVAVDEGNAPFQSNIRVMPLGAADEFIDSEHSGRWGQLGPLKLLHVTTDTYWPGRKGTEELIQAWNLLRPEWAELTIHCLPQLYNEVFYRLGDLDLIGKNVKLVVGGSQRGTPDAALRSLFDGHHVLVQPSRSEGFGIMPLSALVYGMPVLTTADAGQEEYLYERRVGPEGLVDVHMHGWMAVPTRSHGPLTGEHGYAPRIDPEQLAFLLASLRERYTQLVALAAANGRLSDSWRWSERMKPWVEDLKDFVAEGDVFSPEEQAG